MLCRLRVALCLCLLNRGSDGWLRILLAGLAFGGFRREQHLWPFALWRELDASSRVAFLEDGIVRGHANRVADFHRRFLWMGKTGVAWLWLFFPGASFDLRVGFLEPLANFLGVLIVGVALWSLGGIAPAFEILADRPHRHAD